MTIGHSTGSQNKISIIPLFVVIFVDAMGWGIVYPSFQPVILNNLIGLFPSHTSLTQLNIWYESMVGIYMLFMFIMSPVLGSLSDRYGRRIILTISMLGNAAGFLLSGIGLHCNSLLLIILGRIIAGATAGSLPIAQAAMMDISSEAEKPKRMSLVAFANLSGFAIGPVLGGLFLNRNIWGPDLSYSTPFWLTMVLGLIGAVLVLTLFKETYSGNKTQNINILMGMTNIKKAFVSRNTGSLFWAFSFYMLAWGMFFSMIPLLLSDRFNWNVSEVGAFLSFTALFLAIGVLLVIPQLMKIAKLNSIVYGALAIMVACCVLFPYIHHSLFLWLTVIFTASAPIAYVCLASMLSNAVSIHDQGKVMGVLGSLVALTWGIGPMAIGYFASINFMTAYMITGASFLVALIIVVKVK